MEEVMSDNLLKSSESGANSHGACGRRADFEEL